MSTTQKIKGGQNAVATSITTEQSQKLIQTMLTMSFGCIAFLRGLFPDDSFIDQRFVSNKFELDYDPNDKKNNTESIRVKTLVKGKSPQVDLFLRWIDEGALDAIKKGFLKCLSFSVFLDEDNPNNLQEVYTFFFDYQNNQIKVDINDTSSSISLLNSRKMLQQLMRRFIIITQSLEPLPEQKFMSMRFLFNDSCPKDYQPPLFRDASNESASLKTKAKITKYSAGTLHTGCHDVRLDVITSNISTSTNEEEHSMEDEKDVIEIDPFAFPKLSERVPLNPVSKPKLNILKPLAPKLEEPSQTTSMLKSFLQSSQDEPPTQAISKVNCECGSKIKVKGSILAECTSCSSHLHNYCYNQDRQKKPLCFTCRSKSLSVPLHKNIELLLNVRKLFKLLMKYSFPGSISKLHSMMGFSKEQDQSRTSDALSFMLINELVIVSSEPFQKANLSDHLNCSNKVTIDHQGILTKSGSVLKKGSQVALTFIPATRSIDFSKYDGIKTKFRYLLFEKSLGKCLSTDNELNSVSLVRFKEENDDESVEAIVNSSFPSTFTNLKSQDVSSHFSQLELNRRTSPTQDSMLMSPFQESNKKRVLSNDEDSDAETLREDTYYTSQPVPVSRRYKKSKTSISNRVLDSIN